MTSVVAYNISKIKVLVKKDGGESKTSYNFVSFFH